MITALVAEILVGSLETFAHKAHLSDFFVAAVIVAIVGNAAEHGGAVIVAYRGKIKLAAEIALSSSAQVAVFLIPAVVLLSWLIDPLALGFRKVEIAALVISLVVVAGDDLGRGLVALPWRRAHRRLRRRRDDVLHRRRRLTERLRLARQRIGREVELRHGPVLVTHSPEELSTLAPLGDAPAVDAVRLEPRDVAADGAADQLGLEAAAPEREDDLRSLRPPEAETPSSSGASQRCGDHGSGMRGRASRAATARSNASASGAPPAPVFMRTGHPCARGDEP